MEHVGRKRRRHSKMCPCYEHAKVQTHYFSGLVMKLQKAKSKKKLDEILRHADPCFIRYLEKCANGILSMKNVKFGAKKYYKLLSNEKPLLQVLADPSKRISHKKQELMKHQTGGFWGALAGIVASALGSLLVNKITGAS